jgi:hypothetical protein
LPSLDEDALCYVISNHGLVAFVMNQALPHEAIVNFTKLQPVEWPDYSIVRTNSNFCWYVNGQICETNPTPDAIFLAVTAHTHRESHS